MLAVYVNKDNPIEGLTLQQLDAIFSKTLKGGYGKAITTWGRITSYNVCYTKLLRGSRERDLLRT